MAKKQGQKWLDNEHSKNKSTLTTAASKVDSLTALFMVSFLSLLSIVSICFVNALLDAFT